MNIININLLTDYVIKVIHHNEVLNLTSKFMFDDRELQKVCNSMENTQL